MSKRFVISRICAAASLMLLFVAPATAQIIRFDTNVGTFDMELNPTGNPNLQAHVENTLAYVEGGFYNNLVMNRADDRNSADGNDGNRADDFVLQMGRFNTDVLVAPAAQSGLIDNMSDRFDPVTVDADNDGNVDFDTTGLTNVRGQVSLALSGSDSNSGTNEFFINLGDNSFLDAAPGDGAADFVPFAVVHDMSTIDLIFSLNNQNLYGGAFTDVPLLENNRLVFVERAFVCDTCESPMAMTMEDMMDDMMGGEAEALSAITNSSNVPSVGALQTITVPEPPALVLAIGALMTIYLLKPNKS